MVHVDLSPVSYTHLINQATSVIIQPFIGPLVENMNKKKVVHVYDIYFDIPYQELRIGEIGYVIGEKWHGKGYGTEACLLYTSRCV